MIVSIHAKGKNLPQALRSWIEERLVSAVARLAGQSQQVDVYLTDENGPKRAGLDQSCRVVVRIARGPHLVIADRDSDIARMIDRVGDRIAQTVGRRCGRLRRWRGGGSRRHHDD